MENYLRSRKKNSLKYKKKATSSITKKNLGVKKHLYKNQKLLVICFGLSYKFNKKVRK